MTRRFLSSFASPDRCSTATSSGRAPAGARGALFAALLLLAAPAAQACTPMPDDMTAVDARVTVWSDGSFDGAALADNWNGLSGQPIRDIGGGRVGQAIEYRGCGTAQWLLFADCTTGSALLVAGLDGPVAREQGLALSTHDLQRPHGPLALTPDVTVADVLALARAEGWTVRTDVEAWAQERGPHNAIDPFMGCEIFYPGSVGASR
jgi:hypothetical protein